MSDSVNAPLSSLPPDASTAQVSAAFRTAVEMNIDQFCEKQVRQLRRVSSETRDLVDAISQLSSVGKRLRAIFALWGAVAAGASPTDPRLVTLGTSLELFQSAALIHDDLIDHSDTRRGLPSVHRRLETVHRTRGWNRSPEEFGVAAAILAGDVALAFSESLFHQSQAGDVARELFDEMRTQVMAGQYLDLLAEQTGASLSADEAVEAAWTIVTYKSARYSAEKPTLLGAALAGAGPELLNGLAAFALPAGRAFQLRDDELGVFGDPQQTGKPAGDDIREGKRTLLIALTRQRVTSKDQDWLESALGDEHLDTEAIEQIRELIRASGAATEHAQRIDALVDEAMSALDELKIPAQAHQGLCEVAMAAVRRQS